ncbi:MAG: hypothetical protein AABW68_04690 [archaeon]
MMDTFDFEADFPQWKKRIHETVTADTPDGKIISWLADTTYGVDGMVGACLEKIIDFSTLNELLRQAPLSHNPSAFGQSLAFLTTRKFTQAVNEASAMEGMQKKERTEMAQFIRLYCVRRLLGHSGVYLNYSGHFGEVKSITEGKIQLIAQYPGWQAVKKLTVTEQTLPRTFMEFLGSFSVSMENKLESYLRKTVDLGRVDEALRMGPPGKTASDLEKISAFYAGSELNGVIHTLSKSAKGIEPLRMEAILRAYAARKLLEPTKQYALYSQVEIPGLKRLLKKKR